MPLLLCNDCLAVIEAEGAEAIAYEDEEKLCHCGGQVCGCPSCEFIATEIRAHGIEETKKRHPEQFNTEN